MFVGELSSEVLTPFRDQEIWRVARAVRARKAKPLQDAIPVFTLASTFLRRHPSTTSTPISVQAGSDHATVCTCLPGVLIYKEKLSNMFTFTPLQGAQSESSASQSLLELDGGVKVLIDVGWDETFDVAKLKELEK